MRNISVSFRTNKDSKWIMPTFIAVLWLFEEGYKKVIDPEQRRAHKKIIEKVNKELIKSDPCYLFNYFTIYLL